ncbi:unnamed protein product [Thlaspi arvense]|uniref:Homeobox domain-containing protein n=1 Tax=Thlaspi arvense TaxID=13288 RepID=A0AAU9T2V2_THLAR|nr:unnamed protein product [Thlaspi arvense]
MEDNEASLIEDLAVHILSILEKTSLSSGIQGLHSDEDVQPKKKTRKDGDEADTVEETTSASDASAMLRNSSERAFKGIPSNGLEHTVCIYCADTLQYSFASHLSVGFHRKGISASVNCNGTLDVIEEASASVVVISKTYLSSPSCLDKLVKVLQLVQLVVPVFYGISPSDVAVEKEQESADRVKDWSSALQELRELPGTHSREESSECELVEEIVKDGLYRLLDEHFGKILKEIPRVCSSITRPSLPGEKISKKRTLVGKELSEMETTLLNFRLRAPYKIHDLFKSSYESLNDNEKDIFLDIACFFKGEDVDYVMQLLEECGLFPHVGIDVLVEKCLVTISENRVEMHRIIQDFGREIINGETVQIERRRRLWEPWTVKFLLEDDKLEANEYPKPTCKRALGTEDIEGIFLDTSNLLFDVKPTAFENMLNLRFLKIYCSSHVNHCELCLPRGLESLPYELRLLHWENYPLHSLPQDFEPSHLVELNMSYSQLQMLWGGTKNLDMLKMVRLCHSQQLTEIGDICKAQNIELIDLKGCIKLQSFPATDHLQHLRVVNLSGCREIKSFSEVSPNIEELDLQGTSIRELPISIGNATSLRNLEEISCITNSTSLISMDLDEDNSLPVVTISDNSGSRCIEVRRAKRGKLYVLRGEQNDEHHVSFTFILRDENEITLSSCFPFYQESDNASKVSREVVELLESTDLDVTFLAELIDILLVNLIPTWKTDVTVDHLIPWQSPLNPNSRSQQNEAKTQKDWTWSRSPPPPPQQPPSPASTTTTRSHENSSTLHMLIPNPSHYQVYANAMSMHQLPHQHNQQPTWQSPSSSDHHHNSQTEIGTVHVENSGKGLSLSRSSSLQAAEKAEEYRNIYYGSNSSNAPSHHQYNQLKTPFADFSQHHQLPNQFRSSPAASTSSIGATNILRNSRYTKAAQELWEEVCSVGREFTKKAKTRNSLNPNTSGGSGGGGGSPSSARAIKDHPPLSASDRIEHQRRKVKLLSMLDEVYRRYNDYCEHLQVVVNSLDIVMGPGAALPYTALAQKSMSRHFRCLKDAVAAQLRQSCELLDKDGAGISSSGLTKGETPRLRLVEQSLRLQRAFNQMGTMEQEAWRPQRGLHERSVSILRAWLFEHFLHPYPSDADKHLLARQTGLSRNQVSNWFINARVRLWKPMVEEMYQSAADADTAVETGQGLGSPDIDAYENDPSSLLLPASSYSKAASV